MVCSEAGRETSSCGQGYTDTGTGLIKLGYRYYDPTHGRFTQTDPARVEANLYLYAGANPINGIDPLEARHIRVGIQRMYLLRLWLSQPEQ